MALRLSSPSISHSKPRLISVGGSITSSPGLVLMPGPAAAAATATARHHKTESMPALRENRLNGTIAFLHQMKGSAEHRDLHLPVVEAQLVKDRGVKIAAVVRIRHGAIAHLVGFAVRDPALDAAARRARPSSLAGCDPCR